jgi:hypothetical protein
MKKLKPEPDPYIVLADRLKIARSKLRDPEVRKLFAEHFAATRQIITTAINPVTSLPKPPGAVRCSRAGQILRTVPSATQKRTTEKFV